MKTLGFGLKSLLKDPKWAQMHNIDPQKQTAGSVVGNKENVNQAEESIFSRAKKGDVGNVNNIFSQAKIGGVSNQNTDIFSMMNKIDEQHKSLMGAQGVQPTHQIDPMNTLDPNEMQKKLGKKLNIFM